jgi:hypothetical protein
MTIRKPNPFDTAKIDQRDIPLIKASKVLLSDPNILEKLKHVSKPYRGGQTLEYGVQYPNADEDLYVDLEMLTLTLLNEVIHLRQQIGLVCESSYKATNGMFYIDPRAPHLKQDGSTTDEPVYIEDYIAIRKRK